MIVYLIRNTVNSKVYIGKTIRPIERRWYQHKLEARNPNSRWPIYCAIRKYGVENFTIEILASATSLEELNRTELALIEEHHSREKEFGYNIRAGGEGGNFTEEGLANLRASHRTPEFRHKMSEVMQGKNKGNLHTAEYRRHMSDLMSGESNPMHGKTPWKGRHHSEETKRKLSEDRRGSKNPMFGRRKLV